MDMPVTCPKCATKMSVPDRYAGKQLRCLKCRAPFQVPEATSVPPHPEPSSEQPLAHTDVSGPKAELLMSRVEWNIGGDIRNKGILEYVAKYVAPDEKIVATLLGLGEQTSIGALFGEQAGAALGGDYLLVTDKKVVVIKSGVGTWGTGSFGLKTKAFLYEHIASVDVSKRWISGEIEIVSSGMVEKSFGGFFAGASKDSVVQFEKKYFDEVQKLAARIHELAAQARQPRGTAAADIPGQIKKLAELRVAGILSEEEFAEQKRKLLGKL